MPSSLRYLQWVGLALFAISACAPAFPFHIQTEGLPSRLQNGGEGVVIFGPPGPVRVPADEIVQGAALWTIAGESPVEALWTRRPIYVYALLPIWIFALLIARLSRRAAGTLLWLVTFGVIAVEAHYLGSDYMSFLPSPFGRMETVLIWILVVFMLVYRRKPYRGLGDVEASVSAQALLSLAHVLTLPATYARDLIATGGTLPDTAARVADVFEPGFWIGMLGLLAATVPGYLPRRRVVDAPPVEAEPAGITA